MISFKRAGAILMVLALLVGTLSMTSCKKDGDKEGTSSASTSQGSSKDDKGSSKDDKSSSSKDGKDKGSDAAPADELPGDSLAAYPPPPNAEELMSQNIYIINLDSGREVWGRNEDARISPASVTKVMTCLLALENVKDLDGETTSLSADINNYLYEARVDTLGGIYMDETFSIRDLLYAMMLQSANEAAMMVGKYVSTYDSRAPQGGDLEVFAQMMNEKAREIGAVNTHFANPTGLHDENNYSTAKDLALIAQYAWENPEFGETFQQIVTTNAYKSNPTTRHPDGITWYSTLLPQQSSQTAYYTADLRGIKTGTLKDQNIHNFVSTASRDGYTYLMAVCGAPVYNEEGEEYKYNLSFIDTKTLYEKYCFDYFQVKTLINVGDPVTAIKVNLAWDKPEINVIAADKFATLVTSETTADSLTMVPVFPNGKPKVNEDKQTEYYFDAPIKKGQELGYVKITTAGNLELGTVRLVAAESAERSNWLYYVSLVKAFMSKFVFKFLLTFVIVVVVLYIILMIIRNRNRKRYRMKRRPPRPPHR